MKNICLLCLCVIQCVFLPAQTDDLPLSPVPNDQIQRTRLKVEFGLDMGFPTGQFKSEIDRGLVFGKSAGLLYRLNKAPVDLGFRFAAFSYDHVRRKYDSDHYVQVSKNKIWLWCGVVRYEYAWRQPFSLYFEGTVGWRRFYTKTYSKKTGLNIGLFGINEDDSRFDRKKLYSDWGIAFGGALGIVYNLREELASSFYAQLGFNQSSAGDFYARVGYTPVKIKPLDNYIRRHAALTMLSFRVGAWGIVGKPVKRKASQKGGL